MEEGEIVLGDGECESTETGAAEAALDVAKDREGVRLRTGTGA